MPKGMRGKIPSLPGGRVAEQALRQGGGPTGAPGGGKRRKKGGPWGLIKTR
jgi:hypothetical protein